MTIYDKKKLKNRTFIEQIISLYDMGYELEEYLDEGLNKKQNVLVSGSNIKTINGSSILGHGNLVVKPKIDIDDEISLESENPVQNKVIAEALDTKQNVLVSGENIKTILNNGVVGSGNLTLNDLGLGDIQSIDIEIIES